MEEYGQLKLNMLIWLIQLRTKAPLCKGSCQRS